MPEEQKKALQAQIKSLPIAKQEQLVAELVAHQKRREGLSEEERAKEDAENQEMSVKF